MIASIVAIALFQAPPDLAKLGERLAVSIDVRSAPFSDAGKDYKVNGDQATDAAMAKYVPLFVTEWSRYTADVMRKAKVTKIVFCEKLALGQQIRAAVPAYGLDAMYYDPALGAYSPSYQKSVIHHEFFHMMDYQMGRSEVDREWVAMNPPEFQYGSGGAKMRTSGVGNLTKEIPGFITMYGTSAMEEDKAELYAHLIVDPKFVLDQAKTDAVLASKIALLKKRLFAFDSLFGQKFWPNS
ncbi:MAG: hypothetical protein GC165_12380 [Armatimonadetes bacterium]|nr:hypothetical protein [Armatimonadota bacterium]